MDWQDSLPQIKQEDVIMMRKLMTLITAPLLIGMIAGQSVIADAD